MTIVDIIFHVEPSMLRGGAGRIALPMCPVCGSLVGDRGVHDRFHQTLSADSSNGDNRG